MYVYRILICFDRFISQRFKKKIVIFSVSFRYISYDYDFRVTERRLDCCLFVGTTISTYARSTYNYNTCSVEQSVLISVCDHCTLQLPALLRCIYVVLSASCSSHSQGSFIKSSFIATRDKCRQTDLDHECQ